MCEPFFLYFNEIMFWLFPSKMMMPVFLFQEGISKEKIFSVLRILDGANIEANFKRCVLKMLKLTLII